MDLSSNDFEEIKFIDQMRALRYLNFSKNKLVTMNLEPTSFESLTMLDLSENQLTNIPTLKSMNYLKILNLSGNQIEVIKGFKGHKALEKLLLQGNKLSNLDGI